ncbi:MAG: T9SS type A sorting domain-containing protein [Chitinophagales bacterium]|nr:T9SS type A sorting domain-containing protein [Chitinophagales bacterium]
MKKIILLFPLIFLSKILLAQIYTVPGAQIQPAWVFPLWFENGNGQKDTVYYSYDINSGDPFNPDYDTIFGDFAQVIDTTKFQVYYGCSLSSDFLASKSTTTNYNLQGGVSICCYKPVLPIILRWDRNLFYSDSLPFPDLDPAPRAEGHMWFDLPTYVDSCNFSDPILMTDTVLYSFVPCHKADSIIFNGPALSYLVFSIHPWDGIILSAELTANVEDILCYTDLSGNQITISSTTIIDSRKATIVDMFGRIVSDQDIKQSKEQIDISNITPGVYLLIVTDNNLLIYKYKFIKT